MTPSNLNHFNPHPREGGDALVFTKPLIIIISIHTPAKGVTQNSTRDIIDSQFQSTPPRRG